ncbi:DUF2490 domain-containing protein [uncultured Aquimarina sp.]|uniref:DUF2490 domain-containing protein n=1 Tax=uncultured Aquimarina sp. TaxID=575652 RepID=UPI00262D83EB|nr:DUF2490 domain-containing protein [uncultured Aquimarina sp.]
MKKTILVIALLACITQVNAQNTGENELGAWYMYFGTNRITDKLSIHSEAQFRFYEVANTFNQLLLRTGLNYHITDNAIATIGYGYINTDGTFADIPGEENSNEHRIFEQFILKNKVGKVAFEHRYRLEQRFISTQADDFTEHRARYRLQLTYPFNDKWFLNVYDEVFINLQEPIFGQNRLYGAIGYNVKSNFSIQVGYLKNHFTGINFDRVQLGIIYNTDFRSKQ